MNDAFFNPFGALRIMSESKQISDLLFILFFPPEFPVSTLAGWEQPLGLWKVRRSPWVGLPNIVPTLKDLLGYA